MIDSETQKEVPEKTITEIFGSQKIKLYKIILEYFLETLTR